MTLIEHLRRLLRAPEEKRSLTARLIAVHEIGRPQWTPRNYRALAAEGFAANPVGYRAVRMIAEAAASVPWLLPTSSPGCCGGNRDRSPKCWLRAERARVSSCLIPPSLSLIRRFPNWDSKGPGALVLRVAT